MNLGSAMPATAFSERFSVPLKGTMSTRTILPALMIAVLLPSWQACTDLSDYDRERVHDAISDSLLSMTESHNVHMQLIEDGQQLVSVHAPYAATYSREGSSETNLRDSVHVTVLDSTGAVKTIVTSREARYFGHESEFHFSEDVEVTTQDGRRLWTDYLEWSQQDRSVHTPDFVIIVSERDSITGYGLTGTDDLSSYRLTEVTGQFEMEQNDL